MTKADITFEIRAVRSLGQSYLPWAVTLRGVTTFRLEDEQWDAFRKVLHGSGDFRLTEIDEREGKDNVLCDFLPVLPSGRF